jgi:SAM-dependent methyltransferase
VTEELKIRWPEYGCEPKRTAVAGVDNHIGEILDQVYSWTIIKCDHCEFIHTIPIPTEDSLNEYYRNAFYEREKPDYIQRYFNDKPWWSMTHKRNIQVATSLFGRTNGTKPRVLDVGTGPAIFLDVAQMFEWETWGIEPSLRCAKLALRRGHNIFQGTLRSFMETEPPKFQFIHAYEVLEHVPNPLSFLEDISGLLVPHGCICIVVPNDYNTLQLKAEEELDVGRRWWLAPPQHLNYFTPGALINLIQKAGFVIQELRGTWPMENFLFAGYNYIGDDQVGRMCHQSRMAEEMEDEKEGRWNLKRAELQQNIEFGVGREIVVIATLMHS